MDYVLGLDLGTSALKGLVVDQEGTVVATTSAEYPLMSPLPGYSEQDPNAWVRAAKTVIKELVQEVPAIATNLQGISFSGQMHSLVLLDEANQVIRPAILWNDVRTTKQCEEIETRIGAEVLAITKNVPLEGFTLPKILWVQENEPENWQKVHHLMLPKDYLAWWLTGEYSMDYSDAAGTLLLDIAKKEWSTTILEEFAIPATILPQLYESSGQVGNMHPDLQQELGFTTEVPIFAGGADNACGALGAGIVDLETGMVSIGTSGVFLANEADGSTDYHGQLHMFHAGLPDSYYSMGVTLAAGNSLNWFRDTFAPGVEFQELLKDVASIPPGSEGLLFTPYIVGERTPYRDSQIRGSFIGMDTRHRRDHFARAVLEGITFSLKDSQVMMNKMRKTPLKQLVSVGGGAKNPDWLQMQADIFGVPVTTLTNEQGPGLGAAMLAAVGSGMFADFAECMGTFVHYQDTVMPDANRVAAYDSYYQLYRKVYGATADLCHGLMKLETQGAR